MKFYARNFIRGLIDGILSVLGVIIGASISSSSQIIIITGISTGIATFIANTASALSAERAEIDLYAKNIAKSMLVKRKKIRGSKIYTRMRYETYVRGFTDGIGSIIGVIIPLVPFLLTDFSTALLLSIESSIILLAILGAFVGHFSKTSISHSALKTCLIGLVTFALCSIALILIR